MKKKALLSSIFVILLCISVIAGSTLALFTDVAGVNIAVTSGKVDIAATYDTTSMKGWSLNGIAADTYKEIDPVSGVVTFENGGTAQFNTEGTGITIDKMTPGDKIEFNLNVANTSDIKIQYRVRMYTEQLGTKDLAPALVTTVKVDDNNTIVLDKTTATPTSEWITVNANGQLGKNGVITVSVEFPNTSDVIAPNDDWTVTTGNPDNEYQGAGTTIYFVIEAVQFNGVPNATNP